MANTPKKVAVIGLDCALPNLIQQLIAEGHLPTFKRLIEGGVMAENCLVPYPTITPPNWCSIATGAWPGTHQITDFHVKAPGAELTNAQTVQAFDSNRWQAEPIWDAADKAGKKCIVFNYPGAWPSHMQNGIMVGGAGLGIGEFRDGLPALNIYMTLSHDQLITTGIYPNGIAGKFKPAEGWTGGELGEDPLELAAMLKFTGANPKPPRTTWYVLARQSENDGYDTVTLSPTKNLGVAFCTLKVGEWSPKIFTTIDMGDAPAKEVFFRVKLIELSEDAEEFRLFVGGMCQTGGWTSPPEIAKEINSAGGTFAPSGGVIGYTQGWFGLETYGEINDQHAEFLGDAATTLLKNHDWDIFFMHSHPPDWFYHQAMTDMDPNLTKDEAKRKIAWDTHLKIYEAQDRMIARILEAAGEDTLAILVSDHGATPDGPGFNPVLALAKAGLTVVDSGQSDGGRGAHGERLIAIDYAKSRAVPQRSIYVYVNLKGRDPQGCVEPEDYEKVQHEIVDALLTYVDPHTGTRPVALALAKKDARILGLYGEGIGDVVYAIYPWYGAQHGMLLPTAEWGVGTLKGLLVLNGPGIKQGYKMERSCSLPDLVPTVCYALDLPLPAQAEGGIMYQAFADPNFKLKEVQRLREGLAKMETSLAGGKE